MMEELNAVPLRQGSFGRYYLYTCNGLGAAGIIVPVYAASSGRRAGRATIH